MHRRASLEQQLHRLLIAAEHLRAYAVQAAAPRRNGCGPTCNGSTSQAMLQLGMQPRVGWAQARGTAAPSAVSPPREVASRSARASSNSRAALLPAAQATESGATPSWSLALTAAPWSSSSRIASSWPHCARQNLARCMHGTRMVHACGTRTEVACQALGTCMAACMACACAAWWSGVRPSASGALTRASRAEHESRTRSSSTWPELAARCSAVQPLEASRTVTSTPATHAKEDRGTKAHGSLRGRGRTFLDERFDTESVSKVGSDQKLLGVYAWQVILHGHHLLATTPRLWLVSLQRSHQFLPEGRAMFGKVSADTRPNHYFITYRPVILYISPFPRVGKGAAV